MLMLKYSGFFSFGEFTGERIYIKVFRPNIYVQLIIQIGVDRGCKVGM
jgi:hypothetical protein